MAFQRLYIACHSAVSSPVVNCFEVEGDAILKIFLTSQSSYFQNNGPMLKITVVILKMDDFSVFAFENFHVATYHDK